MIPLMGKIDSTYKKYFGKEKKKKIPKDIED